MVLQRNSEITIWGWADVGEQIKVESSWLNTTFNVKTGVDGKWRLKLKTTGDKNPQHIKLSSESSKIILDNILFGEVWLCSGQSNMEQPVKGYYGQPTFGGQDAILYSRNPNLRLFTVKQAGSKQPLEDIGKYSAWEEANPSNVSAFSAVGYFFGEQLQKILDCPVGLINASYGSSFVEAWMSFEELSKFQNVALDEYDINEKTFKVPTALFNAMIKPIIPYTIKGTIWYQGESNRYKPEEYKMLFPAMVKQWRTEWDIGNFPFYFTQIAPFNYWEDPENTEFNTPVNSAFMREAQLECAEWIPNSGIAVTLDVGDENCIHPPKKKEVAGRLLLHALHKTYHHKIDCDSPAYESLEQKDGGILLKFKNNNMGLYSVERDISGFEIAGDDKVFYKANARIVNYGEVFVKSEHVKNPIAVRYAWRNWVIGSLYGGNLLPVSSFRSDRWKKATLHKE
jgi:sialate O-acetylesterase